MDSYIMLDARALYEERLAEAARRNRWARETLFRSDRQGSSWGRHLLWLATLPARMRRRSMEEKTAV